MLYQKVSQSIKKITWKHCFVFLAMIVYYLLLILYYKQLKTRILMFSFFPVLAGALFFGLKAALLLQTLNVVLISFCLSAFSLVDEPVLLVMRDGVFGIATHYIIISLVGFMRDQQHKIRELNLKITKLSRIDELTQLYNRRALLDEFNREFQRTSRNYEDISFYLNQGKSKKSLNIINKNNAEFKKKRDINDYLGVFTCAILDIDSFKNINDSYGHLKGDEVLVKFSEILKQEGVLRKTDFCGRYGGEEFLILLPGTSSRNSLFVIERIKNNTGKTEFLSNKGKIFSITFSAGISQYKKGDKDIYVIIHRADQALYHAKKHGKDQIVIYENQFQSG